MNGNPASDRVAGGAQKRTDENLIVGSRSVRGDRRFVDLEEAERISQGNFGRVYYLSPDQIIKTYIGATAETLVQEEYERSRIVLAMGVPCAIPYGIVDTAEGPGLLYERVLGGSLAKNMARTPEKLEEYLDAYVKLAREMWGTEVKEGVLPEARSQYLAGLTGLEQYVGEELAEEYRDLIKDLPDGNRFLHMDFHWSNVMYQNGECLLIDLPDAATGHPALDLAGLAHAYYLAPRREIMAEKYSKIFRVSTDDADRIWNGFCSRYFGTLSESEAAAHRRAAELCANLFVVRPSLRMLREDYPEGEHNRLIRMKELGTLVNELMDNKEFFLAALRNWKL